MSPRTAIYTGVITGFPRVSGDEPSSLVISRMVWVFSPRERG